MLKRLIRFLCPSAFPATPSISGFPLPYTRLTLDDWRSSQERVVYVQALLGDPMFRDLVGMLANVRPLHRGELNGTAAALLLGQRIGHDQVIATLLSAGTQTPAPPVEIPADYGATGAMNAWEKEGNA